MSHALTRNVTLNITVSEVHLKTLHWHIGLINNLQYNQYIKWLLTLAENMRIVNFWPTYFSSDNIIAELMGLNRQPRPLQ